MRQGGSPIEGAELAEESEGGWFDLIYRLAAVGRTVRVVGIAQQQALLDEELHRIVADGFARVGRVAVAVGGRDEVDDGGDATQRCLRVGPCGIRLKVEQGKQRVGGGFIPLLRTELQSRECFDGFCEPLFTGGGFAVGFIGRHEDV